MHSTVGSSSRIGERAPKYEKKSGDNSMSSEVKGLGLGLGMGMGMGMEMEMGWGCGHLPRI